MVKNKTVFFFSWWKLRWYLFSHNFSLTTLHTIININISKESYYCKVSTPSWRLVWVRTDAWYFLLKAVWLYQLKCWSGDFSLGEGAEISNIRGICVISLRTCVSLYTTYTQTFPFRPLEPSCKLDIGVAEPGPGWCKIVMRGDITILWYWRISAG